MVSNFALSRPGRPVPAPGGGYDRCPPTLRQVHMSVDYTSLIYGVNLRDSQLRQRCSKSAGGMELPTISVRSSRKCITTSSPTRVSVSACVSLRSIHAVVLGRAFGSGERTGEWVCRTPQRVYNAPQQLHQHIDGIWSVAARGDTDLGARRRAAIDEWRGARARGMRCRAADTCASDQY